MALPPEYTRGMHDLGDGCHVWLEPHGSWGLANSGVVVDSGEALVVDTQNDMRMGADLRQAVSEVVGAGHVSTVVNTHADGDHWNGNLFYEGARILSSQATYDEMTSMWLDPAALSDMATDDTAFGRFVAWRIEKFDLTDWRPVLPTETFAGALTVQLGARAVELTQVGPAHTRGDTIVEVESAGVVFAGDVLFADSTPIMWAGPLSRCIEACERIVAHDPRVVIPGHGPVIEADDVRAVSGYLAYVLSHATAEHDAGRSPLEAYRSIDLGAYAGWKHLSRTYQNILAVYREIDPTQFTVSPQEALEVVLAEDDGDWISAQCAAVMHERSASRLPDGLRPIDSHVHVWDVDAPWISWVHDRPASWKPVQRDVSWNDLRTELDASGVDELILVQAGMTPLETHQLLALASREQRVRGVVGWASITSPEATRRDLDTFDGEGAEWLVGIRNNHGWEPDGDALASPSAVKSGRLLAERGLTLDIHVANDTELPLVLAIAKAVPELTVIVDHLGKPRMLEPETFEQWAQQMTRLGELPNVFVKYSGWSTFLGRVEASDVRPHLDKALELFGSQRLMFASNWPVAMAAGSYADTFAASVNALDGCTDDELADLFRRTAETCYFGKS